jgi:hypothetical protein
LAHSPGRDEPLFGAKTRVHDYLAEKASEGAIEFTTIATGPFFDWGMHYDTTFRRKGLTKRTGLTHNQLLGFDIPAKSAIIYGGGDEPFNTTTLASIGAAVASVLSTPEKFKNKHLRISDFYVSQNEILAILEAETGSKFTLQQVDIEKLKADSYAALGRGEFNHVNILGVIQGAVFGQKSSARWGRVDDSESLGIPKKDLTEDIKKVL